MPRSNRCFFRIITCAVLFDVIFTIVQLLLRAIQLNETRFMNGIAGPEESREIISYYAHLNKHHICVFLDLSIDFFFDKQ